MPRLLSIANQKGGVGKTTTAINLARALAGSGSKTLLIDLDPQCNATAGLGEKPLPAHPLASDAAIDESLRELGPAGCWLLPGSRSFRDADHLARGDSVATRCVTGHLANVAGRFDFVVLDLPPSLGQLTRTALSASHQVLMPIQCEYFAMEGLAQMIEVIREIMRGPNLQLDFAGILLTMYDHGLEITHEIEEQVREFFGEIVFETVIPRDVLLSEAPSHGRSVIDHAPRSRGARAYIELGMEVLNHEFA